MGVPFMSYGKDRVCLQMCVPIIFKQAPAIIILRDTPRRIAAGIKRSCLVYLSVEPPYAFIWKMSLQLC